MLFEKGLSAGTAVSGWDLANAVYSGQSFSIAGQELTATGLFFKPDGTQMYVSGNTGDDVGQYTLSTPWDLTTASFVQLFSVAEQTLFPTGVSFKDDGAQMYVSDANEVFTYVLGTAWDISTARTPGKFSVAAQDTVPNGVFFKPDGTKMYVVGNSSDAVHEYTLDTPWGIDTATYAQSFSVTTQETVAQGLFFKPDGTKMYVTGSTGDDVNEYTLSTAWDISTAAFVQVNPTMSGSKSVAAQTGNPYDLFVKPDGTQLYVVASDTVFQYSLSIAWVMSAATFTTSFSVSAQETAAEAIFFSADGTQMYVMGQTGDDVNQYALSTAWDVTTASFVRLKSIAAQEITPTGLFFKPDGTKMYVTGEAGDDVNEYTLSTAWDISTASFVRLFSVAAQETNPEGVFFKPDGTRMYVVGSTGDVVDAYTLSTAWDISTATFTNSSPSFGAAETAPTGVFFKPDGTLFYITGVTSDSVLTYYLSTPWDVSTATQVLTLLTDPVDVTFNPDGDRMYVLTTADYICEFALGTAWDISTITSLTNMFSVTTQETAAQGLFFKPDGTKMYVTGSTGDDVNEYTLSTAWDISTAAFVQLFSVATQETAPQGLFFKPDGTQMYVVGAGSDSVHQYELRTAWNISTAYFPGVFLLPIAAAVDDLFFSPDGTKLYTVSNTFDSVYQYSLSTAWNVNTATYVRLFSVAGQETVPQGLFFKDDGTQMYVLGSTGNDVNQYTLSTAWDISTASFVRLFSIAAQDTNPQSLFFRDDGKKMYVLGQANDTVYAYNL